MSVNVVDYIRYGGNTGYAKSHTTTDVPDFTDLKKKVDKTTLDRINSDLIDKIKTETTCRKKAATDLGHQISMVQKDANSKAGKEELKNVLSATYLDKVKFEISELYKQHIILVQDEVRKSHDKHQKDVVAFENAAKKINSDLEIKFTPINNSLKSFNDRIEYLTKCVNQIGDIETKTSNIDKQIKQAQDDTGKIIKDIFASVESKTSDINKQLVKSQEQTEIIAKKLINDVESKFSDINHQVQQTQYEANKIIGELKSLRKDLEVAVAIECEQKVQSLVDDRFETLRNQLFAEMEERERSKKGFWAKLFSKKW